MDGSIVLGPGQRKRLLTICRGKEEHPANVRLRAHIVLLLADGHAWSLIATVLFCSSATISRWQKHFRKKGVEGLLEETRGRRSYLIGWAFVLIGWVKEHTPRDFGYFRSRWCCSALALLLWTTRQVKISPETVRRMLHDSGMVWRRPRPVLGPKDPQRPEKLRKIRELLRDLPADEAAFFQDEVDLNLNPGIGCAWMEEGKQSVVVTPGNNVKRYLSGTMNWQTGELIETVGPSRNADLFVANLEAVRCRYRRYRKIHIICDNARFHTPAGSLVVRQYLQEHGDRILLHFLPAYSPQDNPIERVWWHLREEVTRNHCCQCIEELVGLVMDWLDQRGAFKIEGRMYERLRELRQAA
jgi:putative transposase